MHTHVSYLVFITYTVELIPSPSDATAVVTVFDWSKALLSRSASYMRYIHYNHNFTQLLSIK